MILQDPLQKFGYFEDGPVLDRADSLLNLLEIAWPE